MRLVAARNGLAATMVALLLQATPALADGAPNLILPLVTAIAFASAASNVPQQVATLDPGRRLLLSLIPKQVQIVDGYQYDFEEYVGLKRPSDMVDSDASSPTISSASPAAAGRPSSPTTKSTAAPSPAAATSSASNSSTASERRARRLSALEGHHRLSCRRVAQSAQGALQPFCPMIQPVGLRPVPESPHGSFPSLCGLPQEGSVPRLDAPTRWRATDEDVRRCVTRVFAQCASPLFGLIRYFWPVAFLP